MADLSRLLSTQEWQVFECKRARIRPGDALAPIVAMANAEGGTFVLGLEDPQKAEGRQRLIGISEQVENVNELLNLIPKEITPPLAPLSIEELPITNVAGESDKLVIIEIPRSTSVHSLRAGDTYLRRGHSNRKLTAEEIMTLKYAKGEVSAEDDPAPQVPMDELDMELLNRYRHDVNSTEEDLFEFLRKNGLTTIYQGKRVLNKAAVLLFGENPTVSLRLKCGIKIAFYYGREPSYTGTPNLADKPVTIEGPLLVQINTALSQLKDWLSRAPVLKGGVFVRELRYPEFALHEAITNAVIHRDYSIQNDIQIKVFDNRVEFMSPGKLPGQVTVRNMKYERFARNPIILRALNRFAEAPNLDIGEGVKRIYLSMKQANLLDPVYESAQEGNFVNLTLYHEERAPYWDQIDALLETQGLVTNKDVREITGIEDSVQVSRLLKALEERKLIEPRGAGKKNRYYVKPGEKVTGLLNGLNGKN